MSQFPSLCTCIVSELYVSLKAFESIKYGYKIVFMVHYWSSMSIMEY